MREDWIEHRRGRDAELLGWLRPEGDGFVVVDLLGRDRTGVVEWFEAEETVDALGLAYLAEPYELLDGERWVRVRISEVATDRIRLKTEDWGAIDAPVDHYELAFPAPLDRLRPLGPVAS